MTDSEDGESLSAVLEHSETVREIASSDAPDAHIHRIILALARGESPKQEDLDKVFNSD